MNRAEALAWVGNLIKIAPQAQSKGHARTFHRGMLIAVDRDYGIVKPARHQAYERIELRFLRRWRSASLMAERS